MADRHHRSAGRPGWAWLALLLLTLIAAAPLWTGPGLVNTRAGGDSPFLFIRLHQLVENLRAGVFPARWMPDAAYGLGYPFFNFYAALPYYFAAIFNLIGFDLLASIKIVQSLGFVFAAWAMYGWVRSASGESVSGRSASAVRRLEAEAGDASYRRTAAWLAAVAYTFAPFHLVNVYVRGDSLSEFYAFAFYPLILWAIDGAIDHPRPRSTALLALAYGGLIVTHNVSALIFSPFVLLYILIRSWREPLRPSSFVLRPLSFVLRPSSFIILHSSMGIVLGLLAAAWYWLPALGEAPLVQLDVQTTGYFNYSQHFRSMDLIQPSLSFDYSTEPPHTPFAMGLAQAIATLAGVTVMIATWRRGSIRLRLFALAGLIISTAMITPLSRPLWDSLPLLPLAQFPWRFLSVQALFASLVIGHLANIGRDEVSVSDFVLHSPRAFTQPSGGMPSGGPSTPLRAGLRSRSHRIRIAKPSAWLAGVLGTALAASTLLTLRPDYLPIRADEITPERIRLYEAFTTNIGTTIRAEYLPRTTAPRPYTGPALIDPTLPPGAIPVRGLKPALSGVEGSPDGGEARAERVSRGPVSQVWTVRAANDSTLAFPTLYFPGWRATIDGQPVEARPAVDLGYIEVDVPAGEYTLALWFDRTPLRAGAEMVSALGMAGVLALAFRQNGRTPSAPLRGQVTNPLRYAPRAGDERWTADAFVLRLWSFVISKRYEVVLLALACVSAAAASAAHGVDAGEDDLVMDFESRPWLHHGRLDGQAQPSGGLRPGLPLLARYRYGEPLRPGTPFTIALWWSDSPSTDTAVTVQLAAPSQHIFGGSEPLASAIAPMSAGMDYRLDVPHRLARGLYYVRVAVASATGTQNTAFLRPVFYTGSAAASDAPDWARVGDVIELKAVHLAHDDPAELTVAFDWVALKPIAANYAISLRVQDAGGRVWVALDTQPGYGFQPTSTWLPGAIQPDVYTLALPADMPRDAVYSLDVVWYRVASQQEIGRVRVPDIEIGSLYGEREVSPPPHHFAVPPMRQRVDATFGNVIRLLGYDAAQAGTTLTLTLHWQALADIGVDYKFFLHVFDPATERIVAQVDAMPGGNAYPTSRWVRGEVVSERVELELELESELELEPGTYRVATGWYDPASAVRLPARGAGGNSLAQDRVILDQKVVAP